MYQKFAYNAGEAYGPAVTGQVELAFLLYWADIGLFSNLRVARLCLMTSETECVSGLARTSAISLRILETGRFVWIEIFE